MLVKIYPRPRHTMQMGRAKAKGWRMDFFATSVGVSTSYDPLMNWPSTGTTDSQRSLDFSTRAEAVNYAKAKGYQMRVQSQQVAQILPKSYADNFSPGRRK